MSTTILPLLRSDDGAYRAWADSQMDVWFEELEEEEEDSNSNNWNLMQLALFEALEEVAA